MSKNQHSYVVYKIWDNANKKWAEVYYSSKHETKDTWHTMKQAKTAITKLCKYSTMKDANIFHVIECEVVPKPTLEQSVMML